MPSPDGYGIVVGVNQEMPEPIDVEIAKTAERAGIWVPAPMTDMRRSLNRNLNMFKTARCSRALFS